MLDATGVLKYKSNLSQYPKINIDYRASHNHELTIGDMHGNALKFLQFLVEFGVMNFQNKEQDYLELREIYNTPAEKITDEQLKKLKSIIFNAKVNPARLRLIGDELADRGENDYFTFLIIKKLIEEKVELEIMLSNHSFEFIKAFENGSLFDSTFSHNTDFNSMNGLKVLMNRGLVTKDEMSELYTNFYRPCLNLISYSLNPSEDTITLYGHAPFDLKVIRAMAKKLDVEFLDDTTIHLAESIERINSAFHAVRNENKIQSLFSSVKAYSAEDIDPDEDPFLYIIWNRNISKLERPEFHNGYRIKYVHGHDDRGKTINNCINLDNYYAKTPGIETGENIIYRSIDHQLKNRNRLAVCSSPLFTQVDETGKHFNSMLAAFKVFLSKEKGSEEQANDAWESVTDEERRQWHTKYLLDKSTVFDTLPESFKDYVAEQTKHKRGAMSKPTSTQLYWEKFASKSNKESMVKDYHSKMNFGK